MEKLKVIKSIKDKSEMAFRITPRELTALVAIIIPFCSLLLYCGVLKNKIHVNEINITKLEAQVIVKEKELKVEINKKVDFTFYSEAHNNLIKSINLLSNSNEKDHDKIDTELKLIDGKIDKLIERK